MCASLSILVHMRALRPDAPLSEALAVLWETPPALPSRATFFIGRLHGAGIYPPSRYATQTSIQAFLALRFAEVAQMPRYVPSRAQETEAHLWRGIGRKTLQHVQQAVAGLLDTSTPSAPL